MPSSLQRSVASGLDLVPRWLGYAKALGFGVVALFVLAIAMAGRGSQWSTLAIAVLVYLGFGLAAGAGQPHLGWRAGLGAVAPLAAYSIRRWAAAPDQVAELLRTAAPLLIASSIAAALAGALGAARGWRIWRPRAEADVPLERARRRTPALAWIPNGEVEREHAALLDPERPLRHRDRFVPKQLDWGPTLYMAFFWLFGTATVALLGVGMLSPLFGFGGSLGRAGFSALAFCVLAPLVWHLTVRLAVRIGERRLLDTGRMREGLFVSRDELLFHRHGRCAAVPRTAVADVVFWVSGQASDPVYHGGYVLTRDDDGNEQRFDFRFLTPPWGALAGALRDWKETGRWRLAGSAP